MNVKTSGRSYRRTLGLLLALGLCVAGGLLVVMRADAGGVAKTMRVPQLGTRAATTAASASAKPQFVKGQAIVKFRAGTSITGARAAAARADAAVLHQLPRPWVKDGSKLVVVHSARQTTAELVKALSADPRVVYAEPDYILHAFATPNDPLYKQLWGMTQIGAPNAWSVSTGSSSVVVADIDTGVDYTHPDLVANMWHNPGEIAGNGIDDDHNGFIDDVYGVDYANYDSNPMDDHGHGTHTSGTMAAVGNNGVGVAGACWTARIMALKFLDSSGSGSTSAAIGCINYAINEKVSHGVNVVAINASWGGGGFSSALRDAITAAGSKGIIFCAAAGNGDSYGIGLDNDSHPSYPASYTCSNIIAVAATNSFDNLTGFSNYGAKSVDLAAPGENILSTVPGPDYEAWAGTSMATPHVTGAIALCAAKFPSDTVAQRMSRVLNNTDPVPALAGKCVTGGRLDLAKAVGGVVPSDNEIPGVPLHALPISGTLTQSTDMNDVYRVQLSAGDVFTATISTGAAGTNFDSYLFGPSATSVSNKSIAVAKAIGTTYPDSFTYTVATTGAYYLDLYATTGTGSYTLTYKIVSDNDIPGKPATAPTTTAKTITGTLNSSTDTDDVYAMTLTRGTYLVASITGASGTDFDLYLYGQDATSISADYPVAEAYGSSYPDTLSVYPVTETGTYYLDANGYIGSGSYTITYKVASYGDIEIPGIPLTASSVTGTLNDSTDPVHVYRVSLQAGQLVAFNLNGAAGTDFYLDLFDESATSFYGDTPIAWADTGSYPENMAYTAWRTGTYYVAVDAYYGYGTGTYTLTTTNISFPKPTVTSPNTAVTWTHGTVHAVTWTVNPATAFGSFRAQLYDSTGVQASTWISPVTPAVSGKTSYSYNWTVPTTTGTHWRVRVYYYEAGGTTVANDISNVDFTIN